MPNDLTINPGIRRYRSVFLSDFHIGAKSFDAPALLNFLRSFECEYLFLVGDIIDGWKLKKRWFWTEECSCIFDEILAKAAMGTKIIYLPGNHDEEMRALNLFLRNNFARQFGVKIRDKVIHRLADGRRFLILHGDQFDHRILRGALARWSDRFYDYLLEIFGRHAPPTILIEGEVKRFSLAKSLARQGQKALKLLNNFEKAIYRKACDYHVDGLICGHTHIPILKNIRHITYGNTGSWLRSGHTALIEHQDGKLKLIDWPFSHNQPALPLSSPDAISAPDKARKFRRHTRILKREIKRIWHADPLDPKVSGLKRLEAFLRALDSPQFRPVQKTG